MNKFMSRSKSGIKSKVKPVRSLIYDDIKFDSTLEINCYKRLKIAGIDFEYHPTTFELFPKFKSVVQIYKQDKRKGGLVYPRTENFGNIKYTPDFVSLDGSWIIECKGFALPKDELVIKLFARHCTLEGTVLDYFMPSNIKQIDEVIRIVKLK